MKTPIKRHCRPKRAIHNEKGASLLEVLISVALLGIIVAVFVQILNNSIVLRAKSDLTTEASAIAMSQIEALKQSDQIPAELVTTTTTTTPEGYTVVTTLTDVTASMVLSTSTLPQADTAGFGSTDIEMTIGSELNVTSVNGLPRSVSLTGLTPRQLLLNIETAVSDPDQRDYSLSFTNSSGAQNIDLGRYPKTNSSQRLIKLVASPGLSAALRLNVNDSSREKLHIGIFEDQADQLTVSPTGTNTTLKITQNLSEEGDPNQLGQRYYEVLVTVSKNGSEYARLLSSWAVKGD